MKLVRYTFLLVLIIAAANFGHDYGSRYWNWRTLSSDEIVRKIGEYDKTYAVTNEQSGPTFACLYVVECDEEGAKLVLIDNIESLSIDDLKDRIWHRRFSKECAGRVTNIGLEFVSQESDTSAPHPEPADPQAYEIPWYKKNAHWTFYNDRFLPLLGRFQSGSFSQLRPWEPCTREKALYFSK